MTRLLWPYAQRTSAMVDLLLEAQSVVEQAWIRDGVLQRFLDSPPPAEAVEEEEEEEEGGEGALPAGYGEGAEAGVSLPPDAGSEEVARAAATVQRCVRRWLARYEAMVLTNQRYYATLDEGSGCYYYIDDWTGEAPARWPQSHQPHSNTPPPNPRCRRRRDFVVPPSVLAQVVRVERRVRGRRGCRRRRAGGVGGGRGRGVGVAAVRAV